MVWYRVALLLSTSLVTLSKANTKIICLFPHLRMKINIGGCVNTLSEECKDFYHKYSGDGRNYTARKVRSGSTCFNF